jgi:hypothetical protein
LLAVLGLVLYSLSIFFFSLFKKSWYQIFFDVNLAKIRVCLTGFHEPHCFVLNSRITTVSNVNLVIQQLSSKAFRIRIAEVGFASLDAEVGRHTDMLESFDVRRICFINPRRIKYV